MRLTSRPDEYSHRDLADDPTTSTHEGGIYGLTGAGAEWAGRATQLSLKFKLSLKTWSLLGIQRGILDETRSHIQDGTSR
jgi:hypothetical protein